MAAIWYILIDQKKEGPFTLADLKRDKRITPDTPVWKGGSTQRTAARHVPELKVLFEEPKKGQKKEEEPEGKEKGIFLLGGDQTLALRRDPPRLYFWLLILAIVLSYVFYQLYF